MTYPLPTRKEETWRYSDLKALAQAHALPPAAGQPMPVETCASGDEPASRVLYGRLARSIAMQVGASHDQGVVFIPENTQAIVVETIEGPPLEGPGFLNSALTLNLAPGARLLHVFCQRCDAQGVTTAQRRVHLAQGAHYDAFVLNIGGHYSRLALEATLEGIGAHAQLSVLQLGAGQQTLEVISHMRHVAPDATSAQTIINVASGQATTSYLGKITVQEGAQHTNAQQNAKGLLLARTATINVKPELEIYADDVKCAHGASIGALDPQALFYLQSRGLTPEQAQHMLIEAFIGVLFEAMPDPEAQEQLRTAALARLQAMWGEA